MNITNITTKLASYLRNNKLWITILISVQIFFISAFSFYYANTNYCCEIEIFSEKPCQVELVTPIGNKYTEHIDANCKTIIPKRPLKQIKVESNISLSYSTNKVSAVDVFVFLRGRGFLLTWIFVSILCITAILINKKEIIVTKIVKPLKQKCHITKLKFYKYLLKGKTNVDKPFKINNKSYILLIVLAVLWMFLAFVPYSHKQIEQNENGKWRALVSLEMKLSGNYIAPTLNGEYYCRKPPLFNYMLLPALNSKQNAVSWMQFISALTAFLLVVVFYLVSRKLLDKRKSLFATIIFAYSPIVFINIITIGLDSLFSAICFLIFVSNLYFAEKKNYLSLFVFGYLLTALAFMVKGTPAIYFQGISLLSIMICTKSFRQIFSWKHAVGTIPFIVIVGTYCLLYSDYNNPLSWFWGLYSDIPEKLEIGKMLKITNMLSFCGKSILAYPILALCPILLFRNIFVKIIKSTTDSYMLLVSVLGIAPFIIGNYYTYYITMFVPLLIFLIIKHLNTEEHISTYKIILLWGIPLLFITIAILIGRIPIYSFIIIVPFVLLLHNCKWLKITTLCIYTIAITILILNIKYATNKNSLYDNLESKACQIARETSNCKLYVLPDCKINHATMYYLTYYKGEIIRVANDNMNENDFYLTHLKAGTPIDSIPQQLQSDAIDYYNETLSDSYLYLYKKGTNGSTCSSP